MSPSPLTLADAASIMREATRDKSYMDLPLGEDVAEYLRHKRKRLTQSSRRRYESTLHQLALSFAGMKVEGFEPPIGMQLLEEFLDAHWGEAAPGTYTVNLRIIADFFKHWQLRERLHGNPTLLIEPPRKRDPVRTVFTREERQALFAAASQRDRIALHLFFDGGLRKSELRAIRFKHFDWQRREVTITGKGEKIARQPLPDATFWTELERLTIEVEAQPTHWLMCVVKPIPRAGIRRFPAKQMSSTAMQRWWVKRWEDAGIEYVADRTMNMHMSRHTYGQRILDARGDLKLAQQALRHADISTTGNIYVNHDNVRLASELADALREDE